MGAVLPLGAEVIPDVEGPVALYVYLLARKWRGAINIASMQMFTGTERLEAHLSKHPPEYWDAEPKWHVYRVFNNGREAEPLTLKESRAIGLRPPKKED